MTDTKGPAIGSISWVDLTVVNAPRRARLLLGRDRVWFYPDLLSFDSKPLPSAFRGSRLTVRSATRVRFLMSDNS